jgi:phosphatidylserine decarboxylase
MADDFRIRGNFLECGQRELGKSHCVKYLGSRRAHSNWFCPNMVDYPELAGTRSLREKRISFVATEGIPYLLLALALAALALRYADWRFSVAPLLAFVLLFLLFRDPHRQVPSVALGVVSPVDGRVVSVEKTDSCVVQGVAHCIRLRVDVFGAYAARSPVEGRIMDLSSKVDGVGEGCPVNALWVETDEGRSVVLRFDDYGLGIPPYSFVRFGERVGQGYRCAYLRLARYADVYLPIDGKVQVEPGQRVRAGSDVIAALPHP